jgi:hypothetical protein
VYFVLYRRWTFDRFFFDNTRLLADLLGAGVDGGVDVVAVGVGAVGG